MGISLDDIDMALFTGHSPRYVLLVIEVPALDLDISFRLHVTGGTSSDGA